MRDPDVRQDDGKKRHQAIRLGVFIFIHFTPHTQLHPLKYGCYALAEADAHGRDTKGSVFILHQV